MGVSLTEFVARARTIAESRGADANKNPIIDAGMTAEALVPHAMRYACEKATLRDLESTARDHHIEVDLSGYGALPESVLRKHLDSSFLPDIRRSSYTPYPDYDRIRFTNLLCYYTNRSNVFRSDCDVDYGELVRTIASVAKVARLPTDQIVADSTPGSAANGSLTVLASGTRATGRITVLRKQGNSTGTLTITQGVQARGQYQVLALPILGDSITVYGRLFNFANAASSGNTIKIQASLRNQAAEIAQALTAYAALNPTSNVNLATYSSLTGFVNITAKDYGTSGNSFTTTPTGSPRVTALQAALTGGVNGVMSGETVFVNGVQCVYAAGAVPQPGIIFLGEPSTDANINAVTLANALTASSESSLLRAGYTVTTGSIVINIRHRELGAIGNVFVLEPSNTGVIVNSGATLTGGSGGFVEGETYVLNTKTFTMSNFQTGAYFIPFTNNASTDVVTIVNKWNASVDTSVDDATYAAIDPADPASQNRQVDGDPAILIVHDSPGAGGNAFSLGLTSLIGGATPGGMVSPSANLQGGGGLGVSEASTIVVNGVQWWFTNLTAGTPGFRIPFNAAIPTVTVVNMANAFNSSTDLLMSVAGYTPGGKGGEALDIRYKVNGTAGNAFTLANSSDGAVLRSASTLRGGSGDQGTGNFTELGDVGRRISITEGGVETVNAIIEERITGDIVNVRDYRTGTSYTEVFDGEAKIYETRLEFIRTGTCTKDSGGDMVVDETNLAEGGEIGYLLIVYDTLGEPFMRTVVTAAGGGFWTVAGYTYLEFAPPRNFNLYRILSPTITLNAASLPDIPTSPTDDIDVSDKIVQDAILTLAGALTGEIPIMTLLGHDEPQEAKSE